METIVTCVTCEQVLTRGRCTNRCCLGYVEVMDVEHEDCRKRIAELKGALRATGHRPYRKNTTHWHEPNESGYCPGCAALAPEKKP